MCVLNIPAEAESQIQISKRYHEPRSRQVCEVGNYTVTSEYASQCIVKVTLVQENFNGTATSRMSQFCISQSNHNTQYAADSLRDFLTPPSSDIA